MQDATPGQVSAADHLCHVEQKYFCFVSVLLAWMAGRSPERVCTELLCTPPTVRNWLGDGQQDTVPRLPIRPHLARIFGCTEDHLDRCIAETERRRVAAIAAPSGAAPIAGDPS